MKKYSRLLILFAVLAILIIFTFLIINNKNKKTGTNSSKDNVFENQNEHSTENLEGEGNNMDEFISKINISINGTNYTVTLEDNETTREFLKRLPLEINMNELNGNEKYYYFDKSLPSNSTQIGKIMSGDLMLYGNDCLVLFYESFDTSYRYTRIGKIDNADSLKSNVGKSSIKVSLNKSYAYVKKVQ